MNIQDYASILLKRWWVIVLAALAAAGAAYGVSKLQPRLYRAQTVYLALANQADNGLNIVLRNTMNSYREIVLQPSVLDRISQELALDVSGESLLSDVTIQTLPDDQKIVIEAENPSLATAQALADAVGKRMQEESISINDKLEGTARINLTLLQKARFISSKPNTRINVLAGALLGLVIGLLLAFVLDFLDDTLKTSADVDRFVGLTTLGAIPTVES